MSAQRSKGQGWLYDTEAEHALIGDMLVHPDRVEATLTGLTADDFFDPAAKAAFHAINQLWLDGQRVDAYAVASFEGFAAFEPSSLLDWMANGSVSNPAWVASRIGSLAQKRAMHEILSRASADLATDGMEAADVRLRLERDIREHETRTLGSDGVELPTTQEVIDNAEKLGPWLIDGLLYPRDTVMIVAAEGSGKTQLSRQVGLCAEAGIHPFAQYRRPNGVWSRPMLRGGSVKVLTVDLENKPRSVADSLQKVLTPLQAQMPGWRPRAPIWQQPSGLDLLRPPDQRRLTAVLQRYQPQLLILGPLYKAYVTPHDTNAEAAAGRFVEFMEQLRRRFGFALWIEHHAPFGSSRERDMRPIGTSLWYRWPEYGRSYRRDVKVPNEFIVSRFRGDRTKVYWPERLRRRDAETDDWPFTGVYSSSTIAQHGAPLHHQLTLEPF